MSRYSPTRGPMRYGDSGSLGDVLQDVQRNEYYDFAREQEERRAQEWETEQTLAKLGLGMTYPNLTYSPQGSPGQVQYADPVLSQPQPRQGPADSYALKYAPGAGPQIPGEELSQQLQAQHAEVGKPVALAGELLPGGGGFASRNVYRTVDTGQYQEVMPGLYQDQFYSEERERGERVQRLMEEFPALGPELAGFIVENPNLLASMPEERLYGPPSLADELREYQIEEMKNRMGRRGEMEDEKEMLKYEQELSLEETRERERLMRERPRTGSGAGSTSLSNNAEYQASRRLYEDTDGDPSDEEIRRAGFTSKQHWMDTYHQRKPRSEGQLSIQRIIDEATLQMQSPEGYSKPIMDEENRR